MGVMIPLRPNWFRRIDNRFVGVYKIRLMLGDIRMNHQTHLCVEIIYMYLREATMREGRRCRGNPNTGITHILRLSHFLHGQRRRWLSGLIRTVVSRAYDFHANVTKYEWNRAGVNTREERAKQKKKNNNPPNVRVRWNLGSDSQLLGRWFIRPVGSISKKATHAIYRKRWCVCLHRYWRIRKWMVEPFSHTIRCTTWSGIETQLKWILRNQNLLFVEWM